VCFLVTAPCVLIASATRFEKKRNALVVAFLPFWVPSFSPFFLFFSFLFLLRFTLERKLLFFLLVFFTHFFCHQGRWPLPRAVSNVDFKLEDINRSGRGGKGKRGRGREGERGRGGERGKFPKNIDMEKGTGRKENN